MRYFRWIVLLGLWFSLLSGCAPQISEKDMQRIGEESKPQRKITEYKEGLEALNRIINSGIGNPLYFQIKPVRNKTGTEDLPYDITEIVNTSVNSLSGELLQVVSHSFEYTANELNMNPNLYRRRPELDEIHIKRQVPNLVVSGAITEFDKNISERESGVDLEGYIPAQIEGRQVDTDLMASFAKGEAVSRITLDLRLEHYNNQIQLPGSQVSNTILVFELEREQNFGFMIYGSGMSLTGRIRFKQGFHQAVRNLVDYSVLQLMGKFYSMPYWKTLGASALDESQKLLAKWRHDFSKLPLKVQIAQIQNWLMRYNLEPVYADGVMERQIVSQEYGRFGRTTQAFALQFLYTYEPDSSMTLYVERDDFPQNTLVLGDLYMMLLEHIPMEPGYTAEPLYSLLK